MASKMKNKTPLRCCWSFTLTVYLAKYFAISPNNQLERAISTHHQDLLLIEALTSNEDLIGNISLEFRIIDLLVGHVLGEHQ